MCHEQHCLNKKLPFNQRSLSQRQSDSIPCFSITPRLADILKYPYIYYLVLLTYTRITHALTSFSGTAAAVASPRNRLLTSGSSVMLKTVWPGYWRILFLCGWAGPSNVFNLANRTSLNRFFGNIPLTALLNTSPPPHFTIILSMLRLFKDPGRVV